MQTQEFGSGAPRPPQFSQESARKELAGIIRQEDGILNGLGGNELTHEDGEIIRKIRDRKKELEIMLGIIEPKIGMDSSRTLSQQPAKTLEVKPEDEERINAVMEDIRKGIKKI